LLLPHSRDRLPSAWVQDVALTFSEACVQLSMAAVVPYTAGANLSTVNADPDLGPSNHAKTSHYGVNVVYVSFFGGTCSSICQFLLASLTNFIPRS
jgi:hypothetical protein